MSLFGFGFSRDKMKARKFPPALLRAPSPLAPHLNAPSRIPQTSLGMSVQRIKLMRSKRQNEAAVERRDIAGLLRAKAFDKARIRAERAIVLARLVEALERIVRVWG